MTQLRLALRGRIALTLSALLLVASATPLSVSATPPLSAERAVKVGGACAVKGDTVEVGSNWFECQRIWVKIIANATCSVAKRDIGPFTCTKRAGALRWTVVASRKWAACDPDDPRIAAAGITLPTGEREEARIAAACVALEWLRTANVKAPTVDMVRSPAVNPARDASHVLGLLATERIIGSRFRPVGKPILVLLIGDDQTWACTYGRENIDPYIPRPAPWTEEWLGCSKGKAGLPWAGSNIELTNGKRFVFSACRPTDCAAGTLGWPDESQALRFGHELVHILQAQLSTRNGIGQPARFDWQLEGVPIYLDMASAWLAGYEGDWRALEDASVYDVWRAENPNKALSINLVAKIDLADGNSPQMQLRWLLGSLATEYLIAHWGLSAAFSFYEKRATGRFTFSEVAFGMTQKDLFAAIDEYLRSELE